MKSAQRTKKKLNRGPTFFLVIPLAFLTACTSTSPLIELLDSPRTDKDSLPMEVTGDAELLHNSIHKVASWNSFDVFVGRQIETDVPCLLASVSETDWAATCLVGGESAQLSFKGSRFLLTLSSPPDGWTELKDGVYVQ